MNSVQVPLTTRSHAPDLTQQLCGCAHGVINQWAGLSPRFLPLRTTSLAPGSVCLAAPFQGPQEGLLCISGTHHLGAALAIAATGDPGAFSHSGEALRELCQLINEAFAFDAWGYRSEGPGSAKAEPSRPAQWPLRHPSATALLMVLEHPLELRLWLT